MSWSNILPHTVRWNWQSRTAKCRQRDSCRIWRKTCLRSIYCSSLSTGRNIFVQRRLTGHQPQKEPLPSQKETHQEVHFNNTQRPNIWTTWSWLANNVFVDADFEKNLYSLSQLGFLITLMDRNKKHKHRTLRKSEVQGHYKKCPRIGSFCYGTWLWHFVNCTSRIEWYVQQYYLPACIYRIEKSIWMLDAHQSDYRERPVYWPAHATSIIRATRYHEDILDPNGTEPGNWF